MSKETRLDDDAMIYQKTDKQSEKEKLKEMSWNQKLSYLWDYYRYHALILIASVVFVSYFIYSFTKPKIVTGLNVVIANNTIEHHIWDEYTEKVTDYLKINPQLEEVKLDYGYYYNGSLDYAASMRQSFSVHLAASEIDVVIAPLSEFSVYVTNGVFAPLSDQLPTDLYSSLTDKFYLSDTEDNPKVAAYGIYIADTKLYRNHSLPTEKDPVLIGITINSKNKENAREFIRYIFNEK